MIDVALPFGCEEFSLSHKRKKCDNKLLDVSTSRVYECFLISILLSLYGDYTFYTLVYDAVVNVLLYFRYVSNIISLI